MQMTSYLRCKMPFSNKNLTKSSSVKKKNALKLERVQQTLIN